MTIGKSICRVSKETLIAVRDVIDDMSENYIEYEYGSLKEDEKDYKYKTDEWNEILKGNDYY
tara:strand:+ start:379 stop:564 length:186 start_codon:yes stop_codon:yes gene_type:complete